MMAICLSAICLSARRARTVVKEPAGHKAAGRVEQIMALLFCNSEGLTALAGCDQQAPASFMPSRLPLSSMSRGAGPSGRSAGVCDLSFKTTAQGQVRFCKTRVSD